MTIHPSTLPLFAQGADIDEEVVRPSNWRWDIVEDALPTLWDGMWITIQITVYALVIAATVGLALALLRRSRLRVIRWPVGFFIEFVRSTPILVQFMWLFFFLPGLSISVAGLFTVDAPSLAPMTIAIWALGIHYACYMSESYRAGITSVPAGQWEACTAVNLPTVTTWREVILPQAIPTVIPALGNYMVAAVKDAPIAMVIPGVATVMFAANEVMGDTARGLEAFTMAGVLFLAFSIPTAMLARYLEKRYGYQRD